MFFVLIVTFLLFLIDCKPSFSFKAPNKDYLSKDNLLPIKVFFVLLVFFSHFKQYANTSIINSLYGNYFIYVLDLIGQLMVAPFFFYSGYGIYEQTKMKKEKYITTFVSHRFLPTYISFVICIFFYCLMNIILQIDYPVSKILLSFTGWESIGNSNWFMFTTFSFYLLFFISFRFFNNKKTVISFIIFLLLNTVLILFLHIYKESWWWNTGFCFYFGMVYSYHKNWIEEKLYKNKSWFIMFLITVVCFIVLFKLIHINQLFYILYALVFSFLLCLIQSRVTISNRSLVFKFLGKHVFSIYILQRISFILLSKTNIFNNVYILFGISLIVTIILSVTYDYLFSKYRNKLNTRIIKGVE